MGFSITRHSDGRCFKWLEREIREIYRLATSVRRDGEMINI